MNMKNSLQLSYSKRIQRPGIWYLNPYIDNLDPKNISYGNPKLNPEHYHSINLNYNAFLKKGNLNLSSYYSFANNGIDRITWVEGDVAYSTYQNVKQIQTIGFSVSFNYNFTKKFSFNTNTSATYNRLENTTDAQQKVETWGWNGFSRMQYTFEKDIKLSAYGGYYISAAGLQVQQGRFFYSGISISKEFFNKKMSFSLRAQNVFWKDMKWSSEINAQTYYQLSEHYRPGRSFGINLSYRFGEMNTQVKKSRRGINNDDLNQGGDQNNMNN
jgi:outer membrane receptor protein involved in Fe transport